jgi:uncharacterized Zn finger protein (UPF0148 family)
LGESLNKEQDALNDLHQKCSEEKALRSEILATKFKVNRLESASALLSDVAFESCPQCGTNTATLNRGEDQCGLCGAVSDPTSNPNAFRATTAQQDLNARLIDIEASISQREKAIKKQVKRVESLAEEKALLDRDLSLELHTYDSAFVSETRSLERALASLDQRLVGLRRDARIPLALRRYEDEASTHQAEVNRLRQEIVYERNKLGSKESIVEDLETYFFEALFTVGFPGLTRRDRISISRRSWMPYILPESDESLAYTFAGAGSGGKKTLFNVCYALAVHRLASEKGLPLPRFLIIDSPMKNIGTEVNKDIFLALYAYLYDQAVDSLKETQFVILDSEMAEPAVEVDFRDRLMVLDDPEHPPLIPYYKGH